MNAADDEISGRDGDVVRQAVFDGQIALVGVRGDVVFVEKENRRQWRRRAGGYRIELVGIGRNGVPGERDGLHVETIIRVRRPDHDGRRPGEENAISRSHHELFRIGSRAPCDAEAWGEIVLVDRNSARVNSSRCELRAGIFCRRLGEALHVISDAEIERESAVHTPVVLKETGKLGKIRFSGGPSCSVAGKRLHVAFAGGCRTAARETREAIEPVRSREVAWEEIQNPVDIQISTELEVVQARDERNVIRELAALDGRLAGTEEVAPNRQYGLAAFKDRCFGVRAVGFARFFVPRVLCTELVEQPAGENRTDRTIQCIRFDQRIAGVLERVLRSAGLAASARVVLMVVSQRNAVVRGRLPIPFAEECVLILRAVPAFCEWRQTLNRTLCR